jgi:hypothetical protein
MARAASLLLAFTCAIALTGCGFIKEDIAKTLGGGSKNDLRAADLAAAQVTTIGVNSYLWRRRIRRAG